MLLGFAFTARAQGPAVGDGIPVDPAPRLAFKYGGNMRFGLAVLRDTAGNPVNKRLTCGLDGWSNQTLVRLDGKESEFGGPAGQWVEKNTPVPGGSRSVWALGGVRIAQVLQIVPSKQPVSVGGTSKRLLDTCLVRYVVENRDGQPHRVGVRLIVDTMIGDNDGVPFLVPGLPGLVSTFKDFPTPAQVPDFVQALERPNLKDPGTIGHMTLRVGGGVEPPGRVSLTCWRGARGAWEVPLHPFAGDSCVVLYWNERPVPGGGRSELGFAYGLGQVSHGGDNSGKLALTMSGTFEAGQPFTVSAYVVNPVRGQIVTLDLPQGLSLVQGTSTQTVPLPQGARDATSVVTWRVRADQAKRYSLRARSNPGGLVQTQWVTITGPAHPVVTKEPAPRPQPVLPDPNAGKFTLSVSGARAPGQVLTVTAQVTNPPSGQTLTLVLPPQLARVEGAEQQPVLRSGGNGSVTWKLKAEQAGQYALRVRSSTGVEQTETLSLAPRKTTGLTPLDALRALKMDAGLIPRDLNLDVNNDGEVDTRDAVLILQGAAAAAGRQRARTKE
jgi:hypothetical protein